MDVEIKNGSLYFLFEPSHSIIEDFGYLERKIQRLLKPHYKMERFDIKEGSQTTPYEITYKYNLVQDKGKWGNLYLKYRPKGRFHTFYINIFNRKGIQELEQEALTNLYKKLKFA